MGTKILLRLKTTVLVCTGLLLGAAGAQAVDLAAVPAQWTPPDSPTPITMWGFIADPGSCPGSPVSWDLGPQQIGMEGGDLTINLRNCLTEPVSLIIPGLNASLNPVIISDGQGRDRATSFAAVAAAGGGTASYTWTNLKSGTFIYKSGTNPAKQVQMGLYGSVVIGPPPAADLAGDVLIFYSEIDPALHSTPAAATPLTYKPKYYLINGKAYSSAQAVPIVSKSRTNNTILIRFCNAGLMSHMPVIQGQYMTVLEDDGNPLPFARQQYSVHLGAGKTIEATWQTTKSGTYAIYDRSLSLTNNGAVGGGLLTYLDVSFPWPMFVPAMTVGGYN